MVIAGTAVQEPVPQDSVSPIFVMPLSVGTAVLVGTPRVVVSACAVAGPVPVPPVTPLAASVRMCVPAGAPPAVALASVTV